MPTAMKYFKKYGFMNYVERWGGTTATKFGTGISPTEQQRRRPNNVDYAKATWHSHVMANGTKTVKVHYTEKKATDFRNFMNKTLNEAGNYGWFSRVNAAALYNKVDEDYGTCMASHGTYKMGDLFDFDGSDFTINYRFNYNFWDRLARLKTLGIVEANNTIENPFGDVTQSFPSEVSMTGDPDGRDLCINFIGDVTNASQMNTDWTARAYLIPDQGTGLTITKQGDADTLVCSNDFELEVVGAGPNINVEVGRPMRLQSDTCQFNPSKQGIIFHVWKD